MIRSTRLIALVVPTAAHTRLSLADRISSTKAERKYDQKGNNQIHFAVTPRWQLSSFKNLFERRALRTSGQQCPPAASRCRGRSVIRPSRDDDVLPHFVGELSARA